MSNLYIGLMSGTSLDGVDGVMVDLGTSTRVLGHCSAVFSDALKTEFLTLNVAASNELHRAALAGNALVQVYAQVVQQLLKRTGIKALEVRAIGAHGQTVRHRPAEFDSVGYTIQINQPALLAELCGIDVVADFRSRDVAAGGQGAPLVPPFHRAFFGEEGTSRAVLNIGGISNVTVLNADAGANLIGFDCGPGNALMDNWCLAHTGAAFDDAGAWAASGEINSALLETLLSEPFFQKPPPKSTGRDLFNATWLAQHLHAIPSIKPVDVQATLTELTALSCASSITAAMADCTSLVVCGGGAHNKHLMARLQNALPRTRVESSDSLGLPPMQVEATAFAWLAQQAVMRVPASIKSVTGARGARILGAIYAA
jgi:anhydro-N-acetylmuramic acid kinase